MAKAKVFVFAPSADPGDAYEKLEDLGCELVLGKAAWRTPHGNHEAEMTAMASGAHALTGNSIRSSPITRTMMQSSKDLRVIAKYSIGVDDVDVEAATEMGILVCHAPVESNWGGVAEGTVTSMLTMLKRVRERDRLIKSGGWRDDSFEGTYVGSRADGYPGITLGIIGLGRIGTRVAKLMRPWGMRIMACDPYLPDEKFREARVERVDLPTLLRESDVVTVHVILTKETRHMISQAELAQMKRTAILINTARGFCVDQAAVAQALKDGTIAGAVLDVFEHEPIASNSPLRTLGDRVILSPHMVTSNRGAGLREGLLSATESVVIALRGEVPANVYNKDVVEQWQSRFGGKSLI